MSWKNPARRILSLFRSFSCPTHPGEGICKVGDAERRPSFVPAHPRRAKTRPFPPGTHHFHPACPAAAKTAAFPMGLERFVKPVEVLGGRTQRNKFPSEIPRDVSCSLC